MADLRWSSLAAPYLVCAAVIVAVAVAAALIRGDRVLRLGVIGAAMTALPWALAQAIAACTEDARVAAGVLRLGNGPVALIGANFMLVVLGVAGQLERHRWVVRIAGLVGGFLLVACWTTDWVVAGAQRVAWGMYYVAPGPLTGIHVSQLAIWLVVGLVIARRASPRGERRRQLRLLFGVLVLGAIGSVDALLLYRGWGVYPVAWLPATAAAAITLYLVLRTDLLRAQGLDRGVAFELAAFAASVIAIAVIAVVLDEPAPLPMVAIGAPAWAIATGIAWSAVSSRPVRVAGERELEQFVTRVAFAEDERAIAERLALLWRRNIGLELRTLWSRDGDALVAAGGGRWALDAEVAAWLAATPEPFAVSDLATMRLGAIRARIEALAAARGAGVIVPLVDRDELVGLVEADYDKALRESERGLVAESARAAARALAFVALARAAARERETAREVEVADALRRQASASRDAELGRWAVAAEYRAAPRTTGAGWSAVELSDGRLALMVTEAQAHGVAAALATAALTGAFAAATAEPAVRDDAAARRRLALDDMLRSMQASSEGVLRGGEPVAVFLAMLDAGARKLEWACAGHPGAFLVGPVAALEAGAPVGSGKRARPRVVPLGGGAAEPAASLTVARRGVLELADDTLLVVASSGLRGDDEARWQASLADAAPSGGRLATVLVDQALGAREPGQDLLAVVVRAR